MARLYTNNYSTSLNGAITNVATTITVNSVTGLPAIGSGDTCNLTIDDGTNIEIVTATAVSGFDLTVTRGQEGTSGTAFADAVTIELRSTAASYIDLTDTSSDITTTGTVDLGGATSLKIPNSATPTVNADGEIALDTTVTDFSHGLPKIYGGEELGVVVMPIAEFTSPVDQNVISYNATNDEFELVTPTWELISTATASASATIDFTGLSSTYAVYKIFIENVLPATDSVYFYCRIGIGGGPTYQSGASDYDWQVTGTGDTSVAGLRDAADSEIEINPLGFSDQGNGATEQSTYEVTIYNPSNASNNTRITYGGQLRNSTNDIILIDGVGSYLSTTAVTAVRFLYSSGNVASGTFRLYGIKA